MPVAKSPGFTLNSVDWAYGLVEMFPGQDAAEFAFACQFDGCGPLEKQPLVGLLLVNQGEHGKRDWTWLVRTENGEHHWAQGGCEAGGWNLESWLEWYPANFDLGILFPTVLITWNSVGSPEQDKALANEIADHAGEWLRGFDPVIRIDIPSDHPLHMPESDQS